MDDHDTPIEIGEVIHYYTPIDVSNVSEAALGSWSLKVTGFNGQGTNHTHRGMGGEYNWVHCAP